MKNKNKAGLKNFEPKINSNCDIHMCLLSTLQEFNKTWNQKCHGEKYKVDTSSMCSVLQYLSEVRKFSVAQK